MYVVDVRKKNKKGIRLLLQVFDWCLCQGHIYATGMLADFDT